MSKEITVEIQTSRAYSSSVNMETVKYDNVTNKPKINGVELVGDKSTADLKIEVDTTKFATKEEVAKKQDKGNYATKDEIPDVSGLPTREEIPTAVSQLENDSGFLTRVPAQYVTETELASKGYLTEHQDISGLATKEEVQTVVEVIPATANAQNPLADQGFVNSSIQTSTAHFRGDWATWADVPSDPALYPADAQGNRAPTPNDYLVIIADEQHDGGTWRYKYTGLWSEQGKNGWQAEYQVNETPLTAAQLAALNSGITADAVASFVKNTDYATTEKAGIIKSSSNYGFFVNETNGIPYAGSKGLAGYQSADKNSFIGKATLENIKNDLVKRAVTENDITLTDDEKTAARTWIGAISNTDYAGTDGSPGTIKTSSAYGTQMVTAGFIRAGVDTLESYKTRGVNSFIGKGTLENVLTQYSKAPTVTEQNETTIELADNTIYNSGEMSSLTITLPTTNATYTSQLNFTSGATATAFTAPDTIKWAGDDITENAFVPAANKRYSVMFYSDNVNVRAIVQGVE